MYSRIIKLLSVFPRSLAAVDSEPSAGIHGDSGEIPACRERKSTWTQILDRLLVLGTESKQGNERDRSRFSTPIPMRF